MKEISVILPVKDEEEKLAQVIEEIKKLDPLEIIVVVNGSTDDTKQIADSLDCIVIEYKEPLGHDVGRAVGAYYANGEILLFVDGDMIIPHEELTPFVKAIQDGHDIALNNLESILELNHRPHSVSVVKMAVNILAGYPHLSINSLVSIPHAISRHALQEIGWKNLSMPPLAQAIAMKKKLSIICPAYVDVITRNRIRMELHIEKSLDTPYSPIEDIIFGDHLSAVSYLLSDSDTQNEDKAKRNQAFIKNVTSNDPKTYVDRTAVIYDESNSNIHHLLSLTRLLKKARADEIILITLNRDLEKLSVLNNYVKVVPLIEDADPFIYPAVGAALSSGKTVLFTDSTFLSTTEEYQSLFQEVENGADLAQFDSSHLLDTIQPIDELNTLHYFLNIILKHPDRYNNTLIHTPHAMRKEAIEKVGYASLAVPPLAYLKFIENKFSISLLSPESKWMNNQKYEHYETVLDDMFEALAYVVSNSNKRGNFSNGIRNLEILNQLPQRQT
jgi:glycosyltransferase involved in cell wall biosynthesis